MKQANKLLSVLLALCLIAGLLPWTAMPARAEEERGKPMQDISAVAAGDTVWFGERDGKALAWRVLSPADEKKLSSDEGRVLLISRDMLGSLAFDEDGSDAWAGSDAQEWCEDLYKNWPGAAEKAAAPPDFSSVHQKIALDPRRFFVVCARHGR